MVEAGVFWVCEGVAVAPVGEGVAAAWLYMWSISGAWVWLFFLCVYLFGFGVGNIILHTFLVYINFLVPFRASGVRRTLMRVLSCVCVCFPHSGNSVVHC